MNESQPQQPQRPSREERRRQRLQHQRRNRVILLICILIVVAIIACAAIGFGGSHSEVPPEPPVVEDPIPEPEPITVTLSVIGDIMSHGPQNKDAYDASTDTYSYVHTLREAAPHLQAADLAIGNLETTFAGGPNYSGYPSFNTPEILADNLRDAGIDMVSTANNHSLDRGYSGLVSTLDVLDAAGLDHVGSYRSQEERDANHGILVEDIDGITVAFLSYTYGTNGIPRPDGKEYCLNVFHTDYLNDLSVIDEELILSDLAAARALETDLICVMMHWGAEYRLEQGQEQNYLADLLLQNGADLVLGGHPHVPEPMEFRQVTTAWGEEKTGFVCFSLGNFISGQKDEYTDTTCVLNLELTKDPAGETTVTDVNYVPMMMLNRGQNADERFLLLDARASMARYEAGERSIVTDGVYARLQKAVTDCRNIFGAEFDVVQD